MGSDLPEDGKDGLGCGLLMFLVCIAIAAALALYGASKVETVARQGYVEASGKFGRGSPTWTARYTFAQSPVRFFVALIPAMFGAVWFASAGFVALAFGAVETVGGQNGRATGALLWLQRIAWILLLISTVALIIYVVFPLKPH